MGHGTRDWGERAPTATIYQLPDMGELAARLGSIDRFDRRGNVVFMEDFESGLGSRWILTYTPPGDAPRLTTDAARSGFLSARLQLPAAGSNFTSILHQEPLPVLSVLGLETSFSFSKALGTLSFHNGMYDGVNVAVAAARYLPASQLVQIESTGSAWIDVARGVILGEGIREFHTVKIVGDYKTGNYIRLILDNKQYDISAVPLAITPTALFPRLDLLIYLESTGPLEIIEHIADVILTQNEP